MIIKNRYCSIPIIALFILLTGCSSSHKEIKDNHSPLMPLGSQQSAPRFDDGYVREAIRDYLVFKNAPLFSQYDFTRKDLNDDGLKDAIVYLKTPYGHWCDTDGCTLLILKAHPQGFSVLGNIKSVRPPFYIGTEKTTEWQDIRVYVSGKNEKAHTSLLSFNGQKYYMSTNSDPYMRHQPYEEGNIFP